MKDMKITLRAARINKGLSREKAAQYLGISPTTLGNYERGGTCPGVGTVKKLEELYGVTYAQIQWPAGGAYHR